MFLCDNNMDLLKRHIRLFVRTHKGICNVCGKPTYMKCTVCNLHCCFKNTPQMSSVSYSMELHNEKFFGLLKCDRRHIFGEMLNSYKKVMAIEVRKDTIHMKKHQKKYYEE